MGNGDMVEILMVLVLYVNLQAHLNFVWLPFYRESLKACLPSLLNITNAHFLEC